MTPVGRETGRFYYSDRLIRGLALRCLGPLYDKAAVLPGGGAGGRGVCGWFMDAVAAVTLGRVSVQRSQEEG